MGASLALMNWALLVMGASLALVAAGKTFRAAQGYRTVPKPQQLYSPGAPRSCGFAGTQGQHRWARGGRMAVVWTYYSGFMLAHTQKM